MRRTTFAIVVLCCTAIPAQALAFRNSATIRRNDFGLTFLFWSSQIADDVHLTIEALCNQENG